MLMRSARGGDPLGVRLPPPTWASIAHAGYRLPSWENSTTRSGMSRRCWCRCPVLRRQRGGATKDGIDGFDG